MTKMVEMNFDGCHIVHHDGRIVASRFFSDSIDCTHTTLDGGRPTGGAGASAARFLSQVPGSVAIKISHDGAITEYRAGLKTRVYCGSRSLLPSHTIEELLNNHQAKPLCPDGF